MATGSNSLPAPVQSVNSAHKRHSRKESLEGGVPSLADSLPPSSFSGISDQKQVMAFDVSLYEVITPSVATASFLAEDAQPEGSENGGVIGADSWPALSKSASGSSTESIKELSYGSLTLSKGMSDGSSSSPEVAAPNHESPGRQWSTERGFGDLSHNNATANGTFSRASNSHGSVVEESHFNPVKSSSSAGGSPRNNTHGNAGQRGGSYNGREPHQPRGPFRRNNSGPQLQGNGSFNQSHGSKRDQERGKQDWSNTNRSFGSRVNVAPQQRAAYRPFIHGPMPNTHFVSPPPPPLLAVRPYGPPVFYNEMSSFVYYTPGPHPGSLGYMPVAPVAPMFYPISDPHLPSKIVSQIDYYFSDENLVKDTYLRQKMDVDGWVPINLIVNFKKIRELTDDVQLILDALRASNVVEIQGEKVRRKGNWKKWIMPPIMNPTGSSP